jgi:serine/threonine protein kinase
MADVSPAEVNKWKGAGSSGWLSFDASAKSPAPSTPGESALGLVIRPLGDFYKRKLTRIPCAPEQQPTTPSTSMSSSSLSYPSQISGHSFDTLPAFDFFDTSHIYTVNGVPYLAVQKIGKGGSSKVYKVLAPDMTAYALKRVDISDQNPRAIEGFIDEIRHLQMLQDSDRIIALKDSEIDRASQTISIVLELGDIDLRSLIDKNRNAEEEIDPNFLRLTWQQMLESVQFVHNAKVIHQDLKPANFLFVGGTLKLIDFGIAQRILADQGTTDIERTMQCGTLNYMPPETLRRTEERKRYKLGRSADVWSLGCILYTLLYNRPPFPQTDPVLKMRAILDEQYEIEFPEVPGHPDYADLTDVMRQCLQRNPKKRPKINELLEHKYIAFRAQSLAATENVLLTFVVTVQNRYGKANFDSPRGRIVLERFAELLRRGETLTTSSERQG